MHFDITWKSTSYMFLQSVTFSSSSFGRYCTKHIVFIIGYVEYCGCSDSLDFHLATKLSLSRNLVWLDIRRCKLSTICFVQYLPKLELLNVTDCRNLYDVDFQVISKCMQIPNNKWSKAIWATTEYPIINDLKLSELPQNTQ
jgi:hypothetical protein